MSSDFLQRILEGLDSAGVRHGSRNKTVAEKTGYSAGTVNGVLSGNAKITKRFIQAVCSGFGIRREWVEKGERPVLRSKNPFLIDKESFMHALQKVQGIITEPVDLADIQLTEEEGKASSDRAREAKDRLYKEVEQQVKGQLAIEYSAKLITLMPSLSEDDLSDVLNGLPFEALEELYHTVLETVAYKKKPD